MIPDLDAIRADLASLAMASRDIPAELVPGLVAELARAQAALLLVCASGASTAAARPEQRGPDEDWMLDVDETATLLGVSRRWVYRNAKRLPFARPISPKILRFSRNGAVKWLASRRT